MRCPWALCLPQPAGQVCLRKQRPDTRNRVDPDDNVEATPPATGSTRFMKIAEIKMQCPIAIRHALGKRVCRVGNFNEEFDKGLSAGIALAGR